MTELIQVIVNGPPEAMPAIVEHVVQSRLAGAGHLSPIESTYWWDEKLNHQPEVCATFHTTSAMFAAVQAAITKLHPYKVPCIVAVPLHGASENYVQWLGDQISVPERPTDRSSL